MTETAERTKGAAGERERLPSVYRPADVEPGIYARWLAADVFAPDGAGSRADPAKPPYVIVMPPPNVTAPLHLGHAARAAVEDTLIRRARMLGRPTLWLPGKDHASIAAQFVLDRLIAEEGETRQSLGRARYLERMWRFMDETRDVISGQHRRIGASADWSRERFTMDEVSARAVRVSFKRLSEAGLIYRAEALINYCPGCRTTLSDLEVIATPETGTLWSVRYHLAREDGTPEPDAWITVATTRPETILGDTAVAVHPEDERCRQLVGRTAVIPFVDRVVPIIADEVVERGFGTGAVKITPAHDHDDHETGKRHALPAVNVLDDEGRINENGAAFAGLDRFEARRRIVAELEARGDLAGSAAHEMLIGRCQRSNDVVEPMLKTSWFVKATALAPAALAAVRQGRTRIVPKRFEKVFFRWLENIHDWNISRQLWWGHRIPAWYCPDGHITVSDATEGPAACETCGRSQAELRQDEDILDTWYSSGLWPFSTLGWPDETEDLARYYPGTVMETAYDILFFWVARMMMLGEALTGQTPFQTVYLAGLIRDPYGQKMSKTRGNVVDPLEIMTDYGADALRFALVHGSTPSNDQRLGTAKIEGGRKFANKLWNAARFVLGSRPAGQAAESPLTLPEAGALGPAEAWILARLARTTEDVSRAYDELQLGEGARLLHEAIWGDYCDWYLELAKVRLASDATGPAQRAATWSVLAWTLDHYLRLLHPLMPFVTEAIWRALPHAPDEPELLIVARWPEPAEAAVLAGAIGDGRTATATGSLIELIGQIRNARAEAGVEASAWLAADIYLADESTRRAYEDLVDAFARLARVRPVTVHRDLESFGRTGGPGRIAVVGARLEARLAPLGVDLARERERLENELAEAERLLGAARERLANQAFLARAPADVVEAARARETELRERVERLRARIAESPA
jgi:valyl-tRNA synthetase